MSLEVAIEKLDGHTAAVSISGPLALGTKLKVLDAQLQQLVCDGFNRVVLDLTGCSYVDSSGLGVVVYTWGLLQNSNGVLRICGLNDRVSALLKLTKTDAFLPCDLDRSTSLAALG
jgi:anti-sigma B factor antagonist